MCSLPEPQDSFLQQDQNLFPYTSHPNTDFMAPWILLTEKPCITVIKSEGKKIPSPGTWCLESTHPVLL